MIHCCGDGRDLSQPWLRINDITIYLNIERHSTHRLIFETAGQYYIDSKVFTNLYRRWNAPFQYEVHAMLVQMLSTPPA